MRWAIVVAYTSIFGMCGLSPAPAADNGALSRPGAPLAEICFPLADAEALLRDVEGGRAARVEADACRVWQQEHLESDEARAEICEVTGRRLEEVTKERDAAIAQAGENLQAADAAAEAARGSWWDRVKVRVTWAGVGAVAAVVGKILLLGGL